MRPTLNNSKLKAVLGAICAGAMLLLLGSVVARADCPKGKKDDTLNIHRVMQNFGRFILPADAVALKGVNPNEDVLDRELSNAIEKLGFVMDCADAVLDNPTGEMLPDRVDSLKGEEREEYIREFLYFMRSFKDEVQIYQNILKSLLAQTPEERDYQALDDERKEVDILVNRAHGKI